MVLVTERDNHSPVGASGVNPALHKHDDLAQIYSGVDEQPNTTWGFQMKVSRKINYERFVKLAFNLGKGCIRNIPARRPYASAARGQAELSKSADLF